MTCDLQGEGELQVCLHQAVWREEVLVGAQRPLGPLRDRQVDRQTDKPTLMFPGKTSTAPVALLFFLSGRESKYIRNQQRIQLIRPRLCTRQSSGSSTSHPHHTTDCYHGDSGAMGNRQLLESARWQLMCFSFPYIFIRDEADIKL